MQANTLEWVVMTLPCLWLFAAYVSDLWAAVLGSLWLAARAVYALRYQADPRRRGTAFALSGVLFGQLGLGAGAGVLWRLLAS